MSLVVHTIIILLKYWRNKYNRREKVKIIEIPSNILIHPKVFSQNNKWNLFSKCTTDFTYIFPCIFTAVLLLGSYEEEQKI